MTSNAPTALIAEDEPLLAQALHAELARIWPELTVVGVAGDGLSAVQLAMAHQPDVLFFDIRMPGMTGLQAATELADIWPINGPNGRPFPALVFVTAYDQYAVQAFEAQAVDYLLKPVQSLRLKKTVEKLQHLLLQAPAAALHLEATLGQLRGLLTHGLTAPTAPRQPPAPVPLKVIQVSVGTAIRLIAIQEVVYFEAADKYVRVLTAGHEYLIRTPLKDLLPQLDSSIFWQIHRGAVVNSTYIDTVARDETGKLSLSLRGRPERLAVSRLYALLFKAM